MCNIYVWIIQNDPSQMSRSEDRLIAWSWRTFVDQMINNTATDPEVILRMPMTKVHVRIMFGVLDLTSLQN